jgi:uncharacterized protein YllA (UPF0747 family)
MKRNTTPAAKAVPQKQLVVLRRRFTGASRRKTRLEQEQKALAQKIRAKGEFVIDKGARTFVALSQAQLITAKVDLTMNRVELRSTVTDLVVAKKAYTTAVAAVKAVKTMSHKSRKAAIKVAPVIPTLVDNVVDALGKARSNGSKEAVESLITLSKEGTKKEFVAKFDEFISSIDKSLFDEVGQEEGVAKATIVSKVMARLKKDAAASTVAAG